MAHPEIGAADLVIGLAFHSRTIVDALGRMPAVVDRMRAAGAHAVVFDVERHGEGPVLARAQDALDAAEAALPAHVTRPIYLAWSSAGELLEALGGGQWVVVQPRRAGVFGGFFGVGEGGVAFFDAHGSWGGAYPKTEAIYAWIAAVRR